MTDASLTFALWLKLVASFVKIRRIPVAAAAPETAEDISVEPVLSVRSLSPSQETAARSRVEYYESFWYHKTKGTKKR